MGDVKPILVVTGTNAEGGTLPDAGILVIPGGGDSEGLARQLAEAAPKAAGIISYGTCGALDPSMKVGDWIIGTHMHGAIDCPCDAAWGDALATRIPSARRGGVYADGRLLDTAESKAAAALTGAIMVDMESHIAARAAHDVGLPFAVLRCVSDAAEAGLPPAIAVAMRPDGSISIGAMALSVLAQPGQIPALVHAVTGFVRAWRFLKIGARQAGARLGFDQR